MEESSSVKFHKPLKLATEERVWEIRPFHSFEASCKTSMAFLLGPSLPNTFIEDCSIKFFKQVLN